MSGTRIPDASPEKSGMAGRLNPAVASRLKAEFPGSGKLPPEAGSRKLLKTAPGNPLIPGAAAGGEKPAPLPASSSNPLFSQAVESPTPIDKTVLARETAAVLGLPKDTLSAALITFTSFFSLPLKSALIAVLRREILASGKASSPASGGEKAALEAWALAMVAAYDKGLLLSPETLERYAAFFAPPSLPRENEDGGKGGENSGGREKKPEGAAEPDSGRGTLPSPEELRAIAEEGAGKDDFLDLVNSAPGKNGQYWLVFPLNLSVEGTELKVFIRILKRETIFPGGDERLIVDISGEKRQWRCFLRKKDGKFRADIQVYPERGPESLNFLRKEAKRVLAEGGGLLGESQSFEEILVRNGSGYPSWMEDLADVYLPSVSEDA